MSNYIKCVDFPLFPLFGVPWAAVIFGGEVQGCCLGWVGVAPNHKKHKILRMGTSHHPHKKHNAASKCLALRSFELSVP